MSRKQKERVRLTALNIFFIVLCFITLIPILYSLSVSLNGQNTLLSSDFSFIPKNFSLENYRRVLFGEDILTWLGNSVYLLHGCQSLAGAAVYDYDYGWRYAEHRQKLL